MSYKTFQNGFPLPASDLNNYLMNQVVATFANSTARSSAIASPQEGQVTYLEDTNAYESWNGSAWVSLFPASTAATSPNYIINGAFDIWQRGTSVANDATYTKYVVDRWQANRGGLATGATISRQTVYDATNLPNIQYAARVQRDSGNSNTGAIYFLTTLENDDSEFMIGQQVTLSFYARAGANFSSASSVLSVRLDTGTGTNQSLGAGLTGQTSIVSQNATLTSNWQRFTYTATVGTSARQVGFYCFYTPVGTAGANDWFEITGVQLERGSSATPFRRNANSIHGELAACQRYYFRNTVSQTYGFLAGSGIAISTTVCRYSVPLPVTMRTRPSSIEVGGALGAYDGVNYQTTGTWTLTGDTGTTTSQGVDYTHGSGVFTQYRPALIGANNNINTFIAFSAEL